MIKETKKRERKETDELVKIPILELNKYRKNSTRETYQKPTDETHNVICIHWIFSDDHKMIKVTSHLWSEGESKEKDGAKIYNNRSLSISQY